MIASFSLQAPCHELICGPEREGKKGVELRYEDNVCDPSRPASRTSFPIGAAGRVKRFGCFQLVPIQEALPETAGTRIRNQKLTMFHRFREQLTQALFCVMLSRYLHRRQEMSLISVFLICVKRDLLTYQLLKKNCRDLLKLEIFALCVEF